MCRSCISVILQVLTLWTDKATISDILILEFVHSIIVIDSV